MIPVRGGCRQGFQKHYPGSLTTHGPVGQAVKGPAVSIRGKDHPFLVQVTGFLREIEGYSPG